jgi:hypothetical protein
MVRLVNGGGVSMPDVGAVLIMLTGFMLIGFGKETQTVTVVVGMAAGFLFGKHTNKPRR